jgi:hypothetical protein
MVMALVFECSLGFSWPVILLCTINQ